jgi:DNA helicase-2/ATP-dependent DNA helicase PcrA
VTDRIIDNPIINSPYRAPEQYFRFDDEGITNEIVKGRRPSQYFIPVPRPRKRGQQIELDFTEFTADKIRLNDFVNQVRDRVGIWRKQRYPHVTPTTRRLLEHWSDPERDNPILWAQREAAETAIYLAEAAQKAGDVWIRNKLGEDDKNHNQGLHRIALKMATGSGKTVVMAMLIAWQTLNKAAQPNDARFAKRFLVITPGLTIRDRLRSSSGIVALGRDVAALNDPQRLSKNMVAAGHQSYERGDMLALAFDSAADEAAWTCDRITRLRGTPFTDSPGAPVRGLSWSDFAVLFRSVAKDADALVAELRRRSIPYVIKGLSRLFDAPEVQACVACFQYILQAISAEDVADAWTAADLGVSRASLAVALPILEEARNWQQGERWGTYNIQRTYLRFLEALGLREETVPSFGDGAGSTGRGELVFYNLGKFSQAISDFEQIYFQSSPQAKYESFVGWLVNQAPNYYAESDADVGYATPDAVTIATVHQAKGMQWPAVFVPALRKNRFPSRRQGGLNVFHVIPAEAVPDAERYRGTEADEIRLFYVAVTRAQKYLHLSFSPGDSTQYRARSPFFDFATKNQYMLTAEPPLPTPSPANGRLEPRARHEVPDVTLSFSDLKYFFECPYEFKLRFLYGFNPPIHEALGYGKSVHDVMAEVHKRAIDGDIVSGLDAEELVDRHLNTPFAYPALRADLRLAAIRAVRSYVAENRTRLENTLYSEQQIQVHVAPGITVDGRIDLITSLDTGETSIVDFKSTERAQAEDITRDQLHIYAVGFQELTGQRADVLEVLNLDKKGRATRELVNDSLLADIRGKIASAGEDLRANRLPRLPRWCSTCADCDLVGLCRNRQ